MSKKPLILGIESSCDETAASLITENEEGMPIVLSNIISSQVDIHKEFGGVVPELASRDHVLKLVPLLDELLNITGKELKNIYLMEIVIRLIILRISKLIIPVIHGIFIKTCEKLIQHHIQLFLILELST